MSLTKKFLQAILDIGDIATNKIALNYSYPTRFIDEDEYWERYAQQYRINGIKQTFDAMKKPVEEAINRILSKNTSYWLVNRYINQRMKPSISRYMSEEDVKEICNYAHWYLNERAGAPESTQEASLG